MKRKITSYYLLVVIASSLLVSCSNDEEVTPVNSEISKEKQFENVTLEKTTLKELGFSSIEEFLKSEMVKEKLNVTPIALQKKSTTGKTVDFFVPAGPTFGDNVGLGSGSNSGSSSGTSDNLGPRQLMTSAQVEQLHLGHNKIKDIYKYYGNTPDGVTINKFMTRGAFAEFNLSDEYGWYTYIRAGIPVVTELENEKEDDFQIFKFRVSNYSSVEDNVWRTFSYAKGTSITKSVKHTVGVTMGVGVSIPLIADVNVGVSYSNEQGTETNNSEMVTHEQRYVATLPAYSQRIIYIIQKKIKSKFEYKLPALIDGVVGVNYPKKVNGAYFWSFPASWLMEGKDMAELGELIVNEAYDIEMFGGPDVKLKDPLPFK